MTSQRTRKTGCGAYIILNLFAIRTTAPSIARLETFTPVRDGHGQSVTVICCENTSLNRGDPTLRVPNFARTHIFTNRWRAGQTF